MFEEKLTPTLDPAGSSPVLLYVEDDPTTAFLFTNVLKEIGCSVQLFVVSNSAETFQFLQHQPPYEEVPVPNLLILDLHLPGEDGFTILERVRQQAGFRSLPTVFFSTSEHPADRVRATALGALQFVHKPDTLPEFEAAARLLCSFAQ